MIIIAIIALGVALIAVGVFFWPERCDYCWRDHTTRVVRIHEGAEVNARQACDKHVRKAGLELGWDE